MQQIPENLPVHIAVIMDGNRRWAKANNLAIKEGHKKGAQTLETLGKFCNKIGIKYLTVYAFSTENWKRSEDEVNALMSILKLYLNSFTKTAQAENIKINVLGNIEQMKQSLQNGITDAIDKTKNNTGLTLNIAFNYGGREEIIKTTKEIAEEVKNGVLNIEDITEQTVNNHLYTAGQPDPDLLIRTSGELRTSNFLPWQLVYSEFYFSDKYWPEFNENDLLEAIKEYNNRNRKFGGK